MVLALVILVGWFLLSFPFAVVVGRTLRASGASGAERPGRTSPPLVSTAVPPRQRGSSAGPRAA